MKYATLKEGRIQNSQMPTHSVSILRPHLGIDTIHLPRVLLTETCAEIHSQPHKHSQIFFFLILQARSM
jgi:hypothetical protein